MDSKRSPLMKGRAFIELICSALSIDSQSVSKVIVEASSDEFVNIYLSFVGDNRLLSIDWNNVVQQSEINNREA